MTNKVTLYISKHRRQRNLRIWVVMIIICLTRPHHATGNFKEFLQVESWVLVLHFTSHSRHVVNQKKIHTYLLGW